MKKGVIKMAEEIKNKENKETEDVIEKAQVLAKEQYGKDSLEFSNHINSWLRQKKYIIVYDVLFSAEGRMNVLSRLMRIPNK